MKAARTVRKRMDDIYDSIVGFVKENPQCTFDDISNFRKKQVMDLQKSRKGFEQFQINLSIHLDHLVTKCLIHFSRDTENKKRYTAK